MFKDLNPDYFMGGIAIAATGILVITYYWISGSGLIRKWLNNRYGEREGQIRLVLLTRLLGVFLFGMIPLVIVLAGYREAISWADHETPGRSLLFWLPFAILTIASAIFIARSDSNLARYPQIRSQEWNYGLLIISALSWVAYLTAYEILFRGYLLFACYNSFGFWPALMINLVIYSLAHIPKGKTETLGSIPVGLIFCIMTLWLGSIWFALLTHITMALSNEWLSLYYSPEMKLRSLSKRTRQ